MIAVCIPLAILLIATAATAEKSPDCIGNTGQVPVPNSCICPNNCACAAKCILNSAGHPDVKSCFVNCVLKNGCICAGHGEADGPAPPLGLPATLDKTVQVTVPRPKVCNKSPDEDEELLLEIAFDPSAREITAFQVQLNAPNGGERVKHDKHHLDVINSVKDDERRSGKAVRRYPIGRKLKDLGAEGDRTIEVSFVPVDSSKSVQASRITVRDARVVYKRNNRVG